MNHYQGAGSSVGWHADQLTCTSWNSWKGRRIVLTRGRSRAVYDHRVPITGHPTGISTPSCTGPISIIATDAVRRFRQPITYVCAHTRTQFSLHYACRNTRTVQTYRPTRRERVTGYLQALVRREYGLAAGGGEEGAYEQDQYHVPVLPAGFQAVSWAKPWRRGRKETGDAGMSVRGPVYLEGGSKGQGESSERCGGSDYDYIATQRRIADASDEIRGSSHRIRQCEDRGERARGDDLLLAMPEFEHHWLRKGLRVLPRVELAVGGQGPVCAGCQGGWLMYLCREWLMIWTIRN